jgi:hypothetical protein
MDNIPGDLLALEFVILDDMSYETGIVVRRWNVLSAHSIGGARTYPSCGEGGYRRLVDRRRHLEVRVPYCLRVDGSARTHLAWPWLLKRGTGVRVID